MSLSIRLRATDRSRLAETWRPNYTPIFAVIAIVLECPTEDGPQRHETWACGPDAAAAERRWRKRNPGLCPSVKEIRTMSPKTQ